MSLDMKEDMKAGHRRRELANLTVTSAFTEETLRASARSGCRFCELLSSILRQVLPEDDRVEGVQESTTCYYTICDALSIHREILANDVLDRKKIPLFVPAGNAGKLHRRMCRA